MESNDSILSSISDFCARLPFLSGKEKSIAYIDFLQGQDLASIIIRLIEINEFDKLKSFLTRSQDVSEASLSLQKSTRLPEAILAVSKVSDTSIQSLFITVLSGESEDINYESILSTPNYPIISEIILSWISSDHIELSDKSSELIKKTFKSTTTLLDYTCGLIQSKITELNGDSTKILRYLTILSAIIGKSNEHFHIADTVGVVDTLLSYCYTPDILMQLVTLELMIEFANTSIGLKYLRDKGHLQWLLELAFGKSETELPDPLVGTQALRIVTTIFMQSMVLHVDLWESSVNLTNTSQSKKSDFLRTIVRHVESENEVSLLAGLYAVSSFASCSPLALQLVLQDEMLKNAWLSVLSRKIDLQAAALNSMANVFDALGVPYPIIPAMVGMEEEKNDRSNSTSNSNPPHHDNSSSSSSVELSTISTTDLLKSLFHSIGQMKNMSTLSYLLKLTKQPIAPLKNAAYNVLRAVAIQPGWGIDTLFHDGKDTIWKEINDVSVEYGKEGKEWRFSVIDAIARNPQRLLLTDEIIKDIEIRARRGPFYRPPFNDVMTMDA